MTPVLALLLQEDASANAGNAVAAGVGMVALVLYLALIVLMIAAMWKIFTKAGEPGWAAIVPIYNIIVWLKIAGRPAWWVVLMLIPFVNVVVAIIASIDFAKAFGKGAGFGLGLAFLPFIFYPILAWGSNSYAQVPATA